jgi:hypothetical protein
MRVDSSLHIHRDRDVFQGIALGDPFMHVLDVHKRHDRFVLYCLVSVSGTKTTPRMQKQPQAYSIRVVFLRCAFAAFSGTTDTKRSACIAARSTRANGCLEEASRVL